MGWPPAFMVSIAMSSISAASRTLPVMSTLSPVLTMPASTRLRATAWRLGAWAAADVLNDTSTAATIGRHGRVM